MSSKVISRPPWAVPRALACFSAMRRPTTKLPSGSRRWKNGPTVSRHGLVRDNGSKPGGVSSLGPHSVIPESGNRFSEKIMLPVGTRLSAAWDRARHRWFLPLDLEDAQGAVGDDPGIVVFPIHAERRGLGARVAHFGRLRGAQLRLFQRLID